MDLEKITKQALKLRSAVMAVEGMATKNFIEDWLMAHNEGLSKVDARWITNNIEVQNLQYERPETGDLAEYNDVKLEGHVKRAELASN